MATKTLTPAMEATTVLPSGEEVPVADHVWTIEEIVALIPEEEIVILIRAFFQRTGKSIKALRVRDILDDNITEMLV